MSRQSERKKAARWLAILLALALMLQQLLSVTVPAVLASASPSEAAEPQAAPGAEQDGEPAPGAAQPEAVDVPGGRELEREMQAPAGQDVLRDLDRPRPLAVDELPEARAEQIERDCHAFAAELSERGLLAFAP